MVLICGISFAVSRMFQRRVRQKAEGRIPFISPLDGTNIKPLPREDAHCALLLQKKNFGAAACGRSGQPALPTLCILLYPSILAAACRHCRVFAGRDGVAGGQCPLPPWDSTFLCGRLCAAFLGMVSSACLHYLYPEEACGFARNDCRVRRRYLQRTSAAALSRNAAACAERRVSGIFAAFACWFVTCG